MAGDTLEIYSRALEIKDRTIHFIHEMIDCETGEIAATCELVGVHKDTTARKSVPLPDDAKEKVLALLVTE